jgi:transketolase
VIGEGSPNKANTHDVHGSPLGDKEVAATKEHLGWPVDPHFYIPEDTKQLCSEVIKKNIASYDAWNSKYSAWRSQNQAKAAQLDAQVHRELPAALRDELVQGLGHTKKEATRNLSSKAIQIMAKHLPYLVGGSADLEPSTKTLIKESSDIQRGAFKGRNVRYGVREHAMGAAVNGLAYERLWIPFCSTFLVFSDYVRPSIRLAALSHLQSLFVFTHDSFWVGEDGPTHEPIEHIQALRIIPNLYTFRPADGLEVGMCYWAALELKQRPSALLFTRQDLPPIARKEGFSADDVLRGAYVVQESAKDTISIVATGSEVHLAIDAAKKLQERGIFARIVSMPCIELFLEQPVSVRAAVLPSELPIVSLEAGRTLGWERIVGSSGLSIGIDHYGASAPGELLAEKFGFTPDAVVEKIVPWLR